jgi:hypothetical protein
MVMKLLAVVLSHTAISLGSRAIGVLEFAQGCKIFPGRTYPLRLLLLLAPLLMMCGMQSRQFSCRGVQIILGRGRKNSFTEHIAASGINIWCLMTA